MAGHSKWANIQHRKGRQDEKRGKLFTKLIREITVAAKLGGADPEGNPRLRAAIDNALSKNMSKGNINRAIKNGTGGEAGDSNVAETRYEGYGPGGTAIIVDAITDNKNRTVAEIRHVFSRYGGKLGTDGSVAYMFTQVGLIAYPAETDENAIMEAALEAGADDVITYPDNSIDVITAPDNFFQVKESLFAAGHQPESTEITLRTDNSNPIDRKNIESLLKLLDTLEELDDVQKVYSNADIPGDVLAEFNMAWTANV